MACFAPTVACEASTISFTLQVTLVRFGAGCQVALGEFEPTVEGAAAWALLVYTVPASPTRKRAAVWREVKRLGALYLRDGVCVLPDTKAARESLAILAERVRELDGQGTLIWNAQISPASAAALHAALIEARQAEYVEVSDAAAELLQHIRSEAIHHSFDRAVAVSLGGDLARLERWLQQIITRDCLQVGDPNAVAATLADCRGELQQYAPATVRTAM